MNLKPDYNRFNSCKVIKRNGTYDTFDINKILSGVEKSAKRTAHNFSKLDDNFKDTFVDELFDRFVIYDVKDGNTIQSYFIENCVDDVLGEMAPEIKKTYDNYNFNKSKYADSFMRAKAEVEETFLRGDRTNANTNSQLASTKRCIGYNIFNKEMYQMDFLTPQELQECRDGYIYIHDMVARKDTFNCCIVRMHDVVDGGFVMGDMDYTEPTRLDSAFNVILAVTKSAAAQQYGGFTIPRFDTLIAKYAEKEYTECIHEYFKFVPLSAQVKEIAEKAEDYAIYKVRRALEQGFQAMEYDLNTVGSSRGDYPFVTITFGLDTSKFGRMAVEAMLEVRKNGEGIPGKKKIVAFPKLVFLYDEELHGEGGVNHDLYLKAVECESKAMYPDMLSLTGEGYVASIYKKYKLAISPMG